jgi:hypothetical protein
VLFFLALVSLASAQDGTTYGLPLHGAEAEEFLRNAEVIEREEIPDGITNPQRLTLRLGERTHRASWKTIHEHKAGMWRNETGGYEFDFRDSWKHEVAAYELDKLLGLGMFPPTVARRIDGRRGALGLWIEGGMSEQERQEKKIKPTSPIRQIRLFNQIHCARLFRQLIYDTDFRNVNNTVVDPDFNVYVIDASRGFRIQQELLAPDDLECFSRAALERLKKLDRAAIEETMGDLLIDMQVEGLLARRDKILTLVKVRLIEKGPGKVLFQ